ncbi:DUF4393 domain-containing protein [Marinilactibacillus psychrotolerans]|uniref:DUF4393 domain-containing protein n=1 Tax=Marinilactibacillus psychrotolerans TaxID=191770 RepID=UPI0038844488
MTKSPINVNIVPDLPESTKEEALNPSANLLGQAFRGIAHKVLDPLVRYNIVKDNEMDDFSEKIRNKTSNIPIEHRDSSKIGLTLKAVEDSSYQLNTEELRELFSNLISASVDSRKNSNLLPSFSTILKDLSAEDARLYKKLFEVVTVASVNIKLINRKESRVLPFLDNIILNDDGSMSYEPISINTLERLGLIKIEKATLIQPNFMKNYSDFKKGSNLFYERALNEVQRQKSLTPSFNEFDIVEGYITLTNLGKSLGNVVIY